MRQRIDVDLDELDQIIDRSTHAPLSESEGQKLKTALHALAEGLARKRSTEKTKAVLPQNAPPVNKPDPDESAREGHGRNGAAVFTGAHRIAVAHATLHSGDRCPACRQGRVYRQKEPATLVRFVGHAPLEATVFETERLRCYACGEVFTAEEPETAGADKYDETAVAIIALLKYGTGVPFNRLERLQEHLGMPLPATTQCDRMAAAAKLLWPVLQQLIRQAAQGSVMHNDDTGMRIVRLAREPGDKRTGTFTSGIVSMMGAWTIALFFTGWKHAGENLAALLKQRARELPPPIQMSDALSRNSPKVEGVEPLQANCLAHGRRQVVEAANHFPEECRYVLETLRDVYHHDAQAREQAMSPEQRLRFHQEHSDPLMKGLHAWMEAQLAEHKTEPNSGLGKAISYLLNHWTKLTLFLRQAGAPIDNNIVNAARGTETVLHVFQAGNDGYFPEIYPVVLDRAGNVYGATTYGGGGNCTFNVYTGCGMIYQLTPPAQPGGAWMENIIWQFQGGVDGGIPGGLMVRNGKLYGEAGIGGGGNCSTGCGYIFELAPPAAPGGSWTKTSLYEFPTIDAECGPTAFDSAGHYYGVAGSANGNGSICEITPPRTQGGAWTERIFYVFKGVPRGQNIGDGSGPLGVTFDSKGNLWGATIYGGYCQLFEGGSCFGTIFELTPPSQAGSPWTETVAYRLHPIDQNPTSMLVIDSAGALYGITYTEAYKFANGALTVIGTFSDIPPNGYAPTGGVIWDKAGNVYGTTGAGGQFGYGTVYKLTAPAYSQTTLHSFAAGADGWNPEGPLTLGPHGGLFGTTQIGGNQGCQLGFGGTGCGTVFRIMP